VSRDEIIAAIQKCAEELGHVPSLDELLGATRISKHKLRKNFGPYVKALEACGLERHGCGYRIGMEKLFLDWAAVTRKLGKTPSMLDYELHGKYTTKALVRHYGGWTHVPAGLLGYARELNLEDEWKDVMDIAEAALKVVGPPARTSIQTKNLSEVCTLRNPPWILPNRGLALFNSRLPYLDHLQFLLESNICLKLICKTGKKM
jgi:hypothetical protein